MKPTYACLFTLVAILMGHCPSGVHGLDDRYKCHLVLDRGVKSYDMLRPCHGWFPCNLFIDGEFPYTLLCDYDLASGYYAREQYTCNITCPDRTTHFQSTCTDDGRKHETELGSWTIPISSYCLKEPYPGLTGEGDNFGTTPNKTVLWTAILACILLCIMICICAMAIKASRRYRQHVPRTRGGSPSMIYSVTLSCGTEQALRETINNYMIRNSQSESSTHDLPHDVIKPPSYEEVTQANGDDVMDKPPPYSEVDETPK